MGRLKQPALPFLRPRQLRTYVAMRGCPLCDGCAPFVEYQASAQADIVILEFYRRSDLLSMYCQLPGSEE